MNLKNIREEMEMSQNDVAKKLNVARSTYSIWEINKNIIPLKHLLNFCSIFDISIDYALGLNSIKKYSQKKPFSLNIHCQRLKEIRKEHKYTQDKLAKKLNTDNGVISRYENGKNLILTSFLINYAQIFNISCDYLLGLIDEPLKLNDNTNKEKISI